MLSLKRHSQLFRTGLTTLFTLKEGLRTKIIDCFEGVEKLTPREGLASPERASSLSDIVPSLIRVADTN